MTEKYFNVGGVAPEEAEDVLQAMVNHLKKVKDCYPSDFESTQKIVSWLKD